MSANQAAISESHRELTPTRSIHDGALARPSAFPHQASGPDWQKKELQKQLCLYWQRVTSAIADSSADRSV